MPFMDIEKTPKSYQSREKIDDYTKKKYTIMEISSLNQEEYTNTKFIHRG